MDLICKKTAERLSREVVEYRVSSTVITRAWYDCNEGNYSRIWDWYHTGFAGVENMGETELAELYNSVEDQFWQYWDEQLLVIPLPDADPLLAPDQGTDWTDDDWDDDEDWDLFSDD